MALKVDVYCPLVPEKNLLKPQNIMVILIACTSWFQAIFFFFTSPGQHIKMYDPGTSFKFS